MHSGPTIHSYEAVLSRQCEQIAETIQKGSMFDEATIEAFNRSRQPNGTYRRDPNDLLLISNAKSLINILHSLATITPTLLQPFMDYMQADGVLNSGFKLAKLAFGAGTNVSNIKTLVNDIWYMEYYLRQLKSVMVTLPPLDKSFLPIFTTLNKTLNESVEPFLKQIQLLRSSEIETKDEEENIDLAAEALSEVLISENQAVSAPENDFSLKPNIVLSICDQLDVIKGKIDQLIQPHGIEPAPETGLYPNISSDNDVINNLVNAANAVTRFKIALKNVDLMVNRHEFHVFDVLKEMGHAIQALEEIKFDTGPNAQSLLETFSQLLKGINPLLIEMTRWLEIAECRLGLRNEALQEKFRNICESYHILTTSVGVSLPQKYPYWDTRLAVRQQEFKRKQDEYIDLNLIKNKIKDFHMNENTSLHELLELKKDIKKINTPGIYSYQSKINQLIDLKTGTKDLAKDIASLEDQVIKTEGKDKEIIEQLNKLYGFQHILKEKIANAENAGAGDMFFYNKNKILLVENESAPIEKPLLIDPKLSTSSIEEIDILIAKTFSEQNRLSGLVAEAEDEVIKRLRFNEKDSSYALLELKNKVESVQPATLYTMSLSELGKLTQEIQKSNLDKTSDYENILLVVMRDRSGLTDLTQQEQKLQEKMTNLSQKLASTKEINDELAKITKEINIISLYKKSVEDDPNKTFSENTVTKIAEHLGITEQNVKDALTSYQASNKTWLGWSKNALTGHPLVNLMNQKLTTLQSISKTLNADLDELDQEGISREHNETNAELETNRKQQHDIQIKLDTLENLDDIALKEYKGNLLSTWKNARDNILQEIREKVLVNMPRSRSNAMVAQSTRTITITPEKTSAALVTQKENAEQLLKRLEDEKKGGLTLALQSTRDTILTKLVALPYFNHQQIDQFNKSKLSNGMYSIEVKDPLIIKNIKSFLNILSRFEFLSTEVQKQLGYLIYQPGMATYIGSVSGLATIKGLAKDFQIELRDLIFYLNELKSTFDIFSNVVEQPSAFTKLYDLANPVLQKYRDWSSMPGVSMLGIDLTKQVNSALIKLNTLAEPITPDVSERKKQITFNPLEKSIIALTTYLKEEKGIEHEPNKLYKIEENNDDDLNAVLILTNILLELQRGARGMVDVSKSHTFKGGKNVLLSLSQIYNQVKKLNNSQIPKLKLVAKDIIHDVHPLLVQIAVGVELSEAKGIKFNMFGHNLNAEIHNLCKQFESMTTGYDNIYFDSRYPYIDEKITVMEQDIKQQNEALANLIALKAKIPDITADTDIDFGEETVSSLVKMKFTALDNLRPTTIAKFYDGINKLIEEKTGVVHLEADIANIKSDLQNLENQIVQKEKQLVTAEIKIQEMEKQKNTILKLQSDMTNKNPISINEINDFYLLYGKKLSVSFEQFCNMMFSSQNDVINKFVQSELTAIQQQLKNEQNESIQIKSELSELKKSFEIKQKELDAREKTSIDLHHRIDELQKKPDTDREFMYDVDTKKIVEKDHAYTSHLVSVDMEMIKVLNQSIDYLDSKTKKQSANIEKVKQDRKSEIKKELDIHKEKFKVLEKKLSLTTGLLSKLAQVDDSHTLLQMSRRANNLNSFQGLLKVMVAECSDRNAAKIYSAFLNQSNEPKDIAKSIRNEASKYSGPIGRWIRNLFGVSSASDTFYAIGKEFSKEKNLNAHFGKDTKDEKEVSANKKHSLISTEVVALELSHHNVEKTQNMLKKAANHAKDEQLKQDAIKIEAEFLNEEEIIKLENSDSDDEGDQEKPPTATPKL